MTATPKAESRPSETTTPSATTPAVSEPDWLTLLDLVRTRSIAEIHAAEMAIRGGVLGVHMVTNADRPDARLRASKADRFRLGSDVHTLAIEAAVAVVSKTVPELAAAMADLEAAEETAITAALLHADDNDSRVCGRERQAAASPPVPSGTKADAALNEATKRYSEAIKAVQSTPAFLEALEREESGLLPGHLAWRVAANMDEANGWLRRHPDNLRRISASELHVRSTDLARVLGVAEPETDAIDAAAVEACASLRGQCRKIRTAIAGGVWRWLHATGADKVPRSIPWKNAHLQASIVAFGQREGIEITIERGSKLDPWRFTAKGGGRDDSKSCQLSIHRVLRMWSPPQSSRHDSA